MAALNPNLASDRRAPDIQFSIMCSTAVAPARLTCSAYPLMIDLRPPAVPRQRSDSHEGPHNGPGIRRLRQEQGDAIHCSGAQPPVRPSLHTQSLMGEGRERGRRGDAPGVITDMLIRLRHHTCQSVTASQMCRAAKRSSSPTVELSYSAGQRSQHSIQALNLC